MKLNNIRNKLKILMENDNNYQIQLFQILANDPLTIVYLIFPNNFSPI